MKKFKLFQTIGFAALLAALLFASCEQEAFTPVNLTGEPAALNAAVNIAPELTQTPPIEWYRFSPLPFGDIGGVTSVRTITNGPYLVAVTSDSNYTPYAARFDQLHNQWEDSVPLPGLGTANPSSSFFLNCNYLITAGGTVEFGAYSADSGTTWDQTGYIGFGTKAGLYGPSEAIYVVAGQNGQAAYTPDLSARFSVLSNDVTGWPNGGGPPAYINAGAYGSGRYVFGGGSGRIAYTISILNSSPLNPWTAAGPVPGLEFPFDLKDFVNAIAYGGGDTFVAVGNTGEDPSRGIIAYSIDRGETWQNAIIIDPNSPILDVGIFALTYADGYFVAVNNNGNPAYSDDGIHWYDGKADAFGTGSRVNAVVFYAPLNVFFAAGNNPNPSVEIAISR
jgi:hypothetical protein